MVLIANLGILNFQTFTLSTDNSSVVFLELPVMTNLLRKLNIFFCIPKDGLVIPTMMRMVSIQVSKKQDSWIQPTVSSPVIHSPSINGNQWWLYGQWLVGFHLIMEPQ